MFTLTDGSGNSFSGQHSVLIEGDRVFIDGQLTECQSGEIRAEGTISTLTIYGNLTPGILRGNFSVSSGTIGELSAPTTITNFSLTDASGIALAAPLVTACLIDEASSFDFSQPLTVVSSSLPQLASTCKNCRYYSGFFTGILPCAIHPGIDPAEAIECPDFEAE